MLEEEFVLVIVHVHVPYRRHDGRFQIPDVGLPSAMHVLRDTRTTIYELTHMHWAEPWLAAAS